MIQLTETEKYIVIWPENSPNKSYKRGKLPLFLPHFEFFLLTFRYIWKGVMTYPKGEEIHQKIKSDIFPKTK